MTRPRLPDSLRFIGTCALVASATFAWAHEDAVIDLEPVETLVTTRLETATGKDKATYKKLQKALRAHSKDKLSRDLTKLKAVVQALDKLKAGDPALAGLLPAAADAADAALEALPERVEEQIDRVVRVKDRTKVEKVALAAHALHESAKSVRPTDVAGALAGFLKAATKYEQALADAAAAIRRAHGGAPQFKTAAAGHVYTVVGSGTPGFNGDGRSSRRSALYFVDEVKFGPDGLLYICDWNNHMVRRRNADGTLQRIVGSGVPGDSEGDPMTTQLNHPSSLAFAPDGRVFLAAWHNHKVKVWDPNAAGGPSCYTIAGTIQGKDTTDGMLATQAKYNLLPGIVRLPNGDLLTCDAANQIIRRVALSAPQTDTNVAGTTVTTGPITRYAGTTGVEGRGGDGGACTDATLAFSKAQNAEPDGRMEVDSHGNVFIVCGKAHVIRKIDPSGTISTFAGSGTAGYSGDGGDATLAQLNTPSDIAIASDDTVYISDSGNNVIRKVSPGGTITTYAGQQAGGDAGDDAAVANVLFNRPGGIELDSHGNLFVCDRYNSRVRVIAAADPGGLKVPVAPYRLPVPSKGAPPTQGTSGTIDTIAGVPGVFGFNGNGRPALDTQLYWPQDIAIDPQFGHVTFLDWNNHRVRRVESDGTVTTILGSGQLGDTDGEGANVRLNHPTDLTFHPITGELWVAGWHTDKIIRLDAGTQDVFFMAGSTRGYDPLNEGGAPKTAILNLPSSVKFDPDGNWYISDEANRRIRYVDAVANTFHTIAGNGNTTPVGNDGPALDAGLDLPRGQAAQPGGRICISPDRHWLYLAESTGHRVRRIDLLDPQRTITTLVGTGVAGYQPGTVTAATAQLSSPTDVDCDALGNVYIADQDNHAIRKVDVTLGTITTIAGTGVAGFAGDGGPAGEAHLNAPGGIHVDRATGRIYVADTYNSVLRVIWE